MTAIQIVSSEIRVGDVVTTHGMRVAIDAVRTVPHRDERLPEADVTVAVGVVLNADEVIASGQVPESYLDRDGDVYRWTVQGNDFARWSVERELDDAPADDAHLEMAFEDAISGGFDDAMEL